MSERKVINKYISPDYDPSTIKRVRKPASARGQPRIQTIRLMAPYSMRCLSCGEYIYRGKKFNAKKEDTPETYYGVRIFRFHIRCTRCAAVITFKTDPKNADYTAESGATRNYEPWRPDGDGDGDATDEEAELEKAALETDAMQKLEAKTLDAKREMDIADALDNLRSRNAQRAKIDPHTLAARLEARAAEADDDEQPPGASDDDELDAARKVFETGRVRRLADMDEQDDREEEEQVTTISAAPPVFAPAVLPPRKRERGALLGVKLTKKARV
ncbi:Pre-mRNA-splicing factor cwf16 [Savitreella phatthalungensis]